MIQCSAAISILAYRSSSSKARLSWTLSDLNKISSLVDSDLRHIKIKELTTMTPELASAAPEPPKSSDQKLSTRSKACHRQEAHSAEHKPSKANSQLQTSAADSDSQIHLFRS